MSKYENSVQGICKWACDNAGLDFASLNPKYVLLTWDDATQTLADEDAPHGATLVSVSIDHPDAAEPLIVQLGDRRQ